MEFPFKAVLFDMDGTITDTTPLHDAAWSEFARNELGVHVAAGDPRLAPGRTVDVVRAVLGREVADEEAHRLGVAKERLFHDMARGKLEPIAGFARYRAWLGQQGIKTALVTNAPWINIEFTLAELDLALGFDVIVGAEDVARGKPHPDPYLLACEKLGVKPAEALVHEDSALGIAAGIAAGCKVSAILTGLRPVAARSAGAHWSAVDYEQWLTVVQAP
ncbi:HAD-IA family hydrolase [Chitinimonas sp.]|uniref:HAD family hydrolase n=1 Tax=Chitinimonas sp. TaxID=1934313 RepID=UPI002F928DAC